MTGNKPALIMIVDDDYDFLELNRMILERAGFRVVNAAEPQQALAKMANEKPDVVISDLMMTSLDSGFSFARAIKEDPNYQDIPVIIATSITSAFGLDFRPRSEADMVEMHIDAFFDKPLDPNRLVDSIRELLGESSQQEATEGD
ncbi:MAG TPA: response regulator [Thermoleophilia bacterium]|nr:response regulator [Thermoleophilia bacterium]